jgi:hypothetical protein
MDFQEKEGERMIADVLTKPLPEEKHDNFVKGLGIILK